MSAELTGSVLLTTACPSDWPPDPAASGAKTPIAAAIPTMTALRFMVCSSPVRLIRVEGRSPGSQCRARARRCECHVRHRRLTGRVLRLHGRICEGASRRSSTRCTLAASNPRRARWTRATTTTASTQSARNAGANCHPTPWRKEEPASPAARSRRTAFPPNPATLAALPIALALRFLRRR